MNTLKAIRAASLCAYLLGVNSAALPASVDAHPKSLSGLWDAWVSVDKLQVPFKFGIKVDGTHASGWFFNGEERVVSSRGHLEPGHLVLEFDSYARKLDVNVRPDGTLDGDYLPTPAKSTRQPYHFHAERAAVTASPAAAAPSQPAPPITGQWLVPAKSQKIGEQAWRFIVRQSGQEVSAALLRVDGDSGALTGTWQNGHLLLSHFDGARPSVVDVTPGANETLELLVRDPHGDDQHLTAYRPPDAQARGLPDAADPMRHTRINDPNGPFRFSFPDLNGHVVSDTDPRFRGKVLIIDIAGSWCPNCHDEAPFLEALYRKYQRRGLEIVMLSFEESEQLTNPERLRAFIQQFGISYTVLLPGTPDDLHTKLPQAVDLDAYPTTFFIGRDGHVRAVHAGFAAAATGDFNVKLKKEFTARVEELLAEHTAD